MNAFVVADRRSHYHSSTTLIERRYNAGRATTPEADLIMRPLPHAVRIQTICIEIKASTLSVRQRAATRSRPSTKITAITPR